MSDVIPTLGRREQRERGRGQCGDVVEGARSCGTHECFEFRERHFNRIEVGTVGRQESDPRADGFDRLANLGLLVNREIVEHDDVPTPQRGDQHLLHVSAKAGIVDGPIEHRRRGDAVGPQRGDDRMGLPMAAGRVIAQSHAAETAAIAAQQISRYATFIQKDVVPGVAQRQPVAPTAAFSGDVGSALFVGVYRFF